MPSTLSNHHFSGYLKNMANYSKPHICHCLTRLKTLKRNLTVTICGDRTKTGKEFVEDVLALACGLSELRLRPGDVVAISAYNSDWYLEWLLAVAFIGGILAPLNYRWSFEESRLSLEVVKPVMLVTDDCCGWYSELQNHIPSLRWHVFIDSSSASSSTEGGLQFTNCNVLTTEILKKSFPKSLFFGYCWAPENIAIICFTSGTTGKPKGVTISHAALVVQSLAKMAVIGYSEDDVYLHTAPLCHIGGISSAMTMLMAGGCHVFIPKFEAKSTIEAIEQNRVTSLITVPAIMADLLSILRLKEKWLGRESVKKILNGGGSLSATIIKDAIKFFPRAKLLSAYGMTETCSSLTFMTLHDPENESSELLLQRINESKSKSIHRPGGICVGKPAPHVEIMISGGYSSSTIGSILTRGPHIMLRYWGQFQAMTSDPCREDWFDTGDVGQIDDRGNLWLMGRGNGRIKSGGENVYPEEVEAVLSQHPGICSVIVVGIADDRFSEMVVACIRIRESWQWIDSNANECVRHSELCLSSEILKNYCKEKNFTGFKVPKKFIVWGKPFPVTSSGKLKRGQVQREAVLHLQSLPSRL
ncbi:hypothetical protein Nepgr_027901 [Nepenthes gracilis]|uniref:4-coumarate--CoA ligase n=1 Tax=Nepenthes gracilis TaxID=150966 RepID=A0AAD3T9K1_NEPGR|nr:hypothetical protein Nepgr_027901 [Nepenthes gracilis]